MATIFESYNQTKKQLAAAGIEDSVFEAKQIIKSVTGMTSAQILANYGRELTEFQEITLKAVIAQRISRYPLQYILGFWDFYTRRFKVGVGALIPRPDTETVVEVCLEELKGIKNPEILDLCAGTGCIGITLACEVEGSSVTAVEKYEQAAAYLKENATALAPDNTRIITGDVLSGAASDGGYDLIVSNPPYLSARDMKCLQPELEYEPETALFGGEDGLDFYRGIAKIYRPSLKSGGALVFEIGAAQAEAVTGILRSEGFTRIRTVKDYCGNDRAVAARL